MEYQKTANLLDNAQNQPCKFRTRNMVELNDELRGKYTDSDTKFKTTMLKSKLWDYADAYILLNGRITITGARDDGVARRTDERDKGVTFKNCFPFTKYIRRINNTDIGTTRDIDIVMPMYNLIEYSDNYSKTFGSLWQYYNYEPKDNIAESELFKSKLKISRKTPTDSNTRNVEIIVTLKYLSNFWRILEMPLINCEVNQILTWSRDFVMTSSTATGKFSITETKLYVPVVNLSTQDNAKLVQQLKSGFKRTSNWNKNELSIKTFAQNRYLNHLINPSFQGVNRLFVLSFENEDDRTSHSTYYLRNLEIEDSNIMTDGKFFFDQPFCNDF